MALLEVKGIKAVYNGVVLGIADVDLSVDTGSVAALLGSNGAGKSTTLKCISGVLAAENGKVTEGEILLEGRRIHHMDPEDIAGMGVCHVLQGRSVFPHLTCEENLLMGAYLRRDRKQVKEDMEKVYGFFPALAAVRQRKSGFLSGGEQQMLVVGRAFLFQPKLMLLDEPSLGLAPQIVAQIYRILRRISREEGTALLIAEQNAGAALSIAEYGYMIQNGRIVSRGSVEELSREDYFALPSKVAGSSIQSPTDSRPS
jgi:branched-chain amino acid transport system ATP-binding protein